jgi:capsid protein
MASVVPAGYSAKTMSPTHPNNGYGEFTKSILKQIASSLGISYAKLIKDYEAVNYSSLREGTLDEAAFYAEQQQFLIDTWKDIEFKLFVEAIALSEDSFIKPSQVKDILQHHTWVCQTRPYFDPAKDLVATERELKLGLKSPLMVMEEGGIDPEELMKSWALYKNLCEKFGLQFNVGEGDNNEAKLTAEDENFDNEAAQDDLMNKERS